MRYISIHQKGVTKMTSPFDNKKLTLMTKTLPGGNFPPNLKADMYKGNPSLFVLTGNKKGEGITFVRAGLEHKTAGLICQIIEVMSDAIIHEYTTGIKHEDSGKQTIVSVECKSGKDRETVAKVVIGRDPENKMFISIVSIKEPSTPVIQFVFGADLFHPVQITGSDKLNSSISALAAKEWAIRTREYWYVYSITNPHEAEAAQQGDGGGYNKGGYNNNNGGGGGYQQQSQGSSDLPWES